MFNGLMIFTYLAGVAMDGVGAEPEHGYVLVSGDSQGRHSQAGLPTGRGRRVQSQ